MKIKNLPKTERPYEKLELYGEKYLSNAELLAIIIKAGTKEDTSVELARKILMLADKNKQENLNFLKDISIEELMQIKGIGKVKAIQLKAICELSIRMNKPSNYKEIKILEPKDIANIFIDELRFQRKEILKLVILNNKNVIIKIKEIAIGGANFAKLSVRDVITEAIKINAPKIALVHNHPTGDSTPSKSDIDFTNQVYEVSKIVGIELIDHIVIGNLNYKSIFSIINNEKH